MSAGRLLGLLVALGGLQLQAVAHAQGRHAVIADDSALGARVAALESRVTRLQDTLAIKRLQRAYGYYFDRGLWDEVASLFSADGRIEMGLDGVYRGRERVRAYLYAYGHGRKGRAPGELGEHLQLMPVITLGADGRSARGTWRDVILAGRKGQEALWGEGPFENEYVKENGIWKIRSLHWFQTLMVPYDGGWTNHADVNGGHYVSTLTPDAPTTVPYKTWPNAFTPPFHFRPSVASQLPQPAPAPTPAATPLGGAAAHQRVAQLAGDVQQVSDQLEIENLQRIYGYYIDKNQWSQAAALFTPDAELEIAGRSVWRGAARIREYLRAIGPEGVLTDTLYDNMQLQGIVHVAADGKAAQGRWHWFAQLARAGQFHEWGVGVYENEYRKVGGSWRIHRLRLFPTMVTPYEAGWHKTSLPVSHFEPQLRPDAPSRLPSASYETGGIAPFHYRHPVTGRPAPRAQPLSMTMSTGALNLQLARIEAQIAKDEDITAIENLQMSYGYYLATLLWDDLAALFEDNGTIEIALRGVYVGRPAVRRNLNLYGQAGLDDGVLHNHMQYQPVISISEDGQHAKLRSRALSMMGNFGKSGMWMGGIYENEFIKVGGTWKFRTDHQMNTYFAPYEVGWKDLKLRPAPGITDSNPPDRPPTIPFEMYPQGFLPPYHYPNPVTGQ
jgi:SnoaL-like domain